MATWALGLVPCQESDPFTLTVGILFGQGLNRGRNCFNCNLAKDATVFRPICLV